jgi:hypothetical protein
MGTKQVGAADVRKCLSQQRTRPAASMVVREASLRPRQDSTNKTSMVASAEHKNSERSLPGHFMNNSPRTLPSRVMDVAQDRVCGKGSVRFQSEKTSY